MPSTNCSWNKDLDGFDDCCIWTQPMVKCSGVTGCESYVPTENKRIVTIPISKCVECIDEEETLP